MAGKQKGSNRDDYAGQADDEDDGDPGSGDQGADTLLLTGGFAGLRLVIRKPTRSSERPAIDGLASIPKNETLTFSVLVDPAHNGRGSKVGREKQWTFSASLAASKVDGGSAARESLSHGIPDRGPKTCDVDQAIRQWRTVRFTASEELFGDHGVDVHGTLNDGLTDVEPRPRNRGIQLVLQITLQYGEFVGCEILC